MKIIGEKVAWPSDAFRPGLIYIPHQLLMDFTGRSYDYTTSKWDDLKIINFIEMLCTYIPQKKNGNTFLLVHTESPLRSEEIK